MKCPYCGNEIREVYVSYHVASYITERRFIDENGKVCSETLDKEEYMVEDLTYKCPSCNNELDEDEVPECLWF